VATSGPGRSQAGARPLSRWEGDTEKLRNFRGGFYECLDLRADALFELTDAILTASSVPSLPHLSLGPIHRGDWGSIYAALSKGWIDQDLLGELLAGG
jgi:hypothetical protein